jgi:hypothetical protein
MPNADTKCDSRLVRLRDHESYAFLSLRLAMPMTNCFGNHGNLFRVFLTLALVALADNSLLPTKMDV